MTNFELFRFGLKARFRLREQRLLDAAECYASRRKNAWLVFQIMSLKRRLGLGYTR